MEKMARDYHPVMKEWQNINPKPKTVEIFTSLLFVATTLEFTLNLAIKGVNFSSDKIFHNR